METIKYSVDFFINKAISIPENLWCVGTFYTEKRGQHCFVGHCIGGRAGLVDLEKNPEFKSVRDLFGGKADNIFEINDGKNPQYQQPTPKQRILAALYDIKKMQEPVKEEPTVIYKVVEVDKKVKELTKQEIILS